MRFDDDDPSLSPLWIGRRAPFHAFRRALWSFAYTYDVRDGRSNDPMSRVSISVTDWHGQRIVPGRELTRMSLPAFEDLLFTVQQLSARKQEESRQNGWHQQGGAENRAAHREMLLARGNDPDNERALLREWFAESARLASQPDQEDQL